LDRAACLLPVSAAPTAARDHIQKDDAPMRMPVVGGHEGAGIVDAVSEAVTRGELADHVICTPGVVTAEIVNAVVMMSGKGGKVTITAAGRIDERAAHVRPGLLIGYHRQVRGALFGDSNPLYDIPRLLGLYKSGQLKLDELVTRKYTLDQVNQAYRDMNDGKNIRGVIIHEH
jgi:S-(hydroxymethyl)glutathione dehydrogenase/alcohol dehydrogenase